MEYTKPTLMLVGEAGALVLGLEKGGGEEDSATQTSPVGMVLGLDD